MESNKSGGLLVGATDKNGQEGIKVIAPNGDTIRMGGGEIIINEESSKKHCQLLSEINQDGGGVAIPCEIQDIANTTESNISVSGVIKKAGGIASYKLGGLFHGSNKKFSKFSLDNVGASGKSTGGWGIYASTGRDVASQYLLRSGALYEVTIYENGEWLDLDEPIDNDLGQKILSGLKKKKFPSDTIEQFGRDFLAQGDEGYETATGKQVYDYLSAIFGSEKNASLFLSSIGIMGNRFKDKTLPDETNYVVFDADNIKIDNEVSEENSDDDMSSGGRVGFNISEETLKKLDDIYTYEFYDNNANVVTKEKATELHIGFEKTGGRDSWTYVGKKINPTKKETTIEYIQEKIGAEKLYVNFSNYFNTLISKYGLHAYPTTYGIGVWLAYINRDRIKEYKNTIEGLLNQLGIKYDTEYSDAGWVFRYKISKSEENINKIKKIINGKSEFAGGGFIREGDFYVVSYKFNPSSHTWRRGYIKPQWSEKTSVPVIVKYDLYSENKRDIVKSMTPEEAQRLLFQQKIVAGSNIAFRQSTTAEAGTKILNGTQTCKCKTMEYHEQLTASQKEKLGEKYLGIGTAVTDKKSGVISNITSIEHRGFKLLPQSSFDGFPKSEFFVSFEEFMNKFSSAQIDVAGYDHTEPDNKLMHVVIKDIIASNIIKELEGGFMEDVEIGASFAGGGVIGEIKASKDGVIKEVRDVDGRILKEVYVGSTMYRRNPTYKTYNSIGSNELLYKSDAGKVHMAYGGIVGIEETPSYYRVDISSPRNVRTCRTPKWATRVAESVKEGAKVVTCKKYNDWYVSSVLVPKGGSTKETAREVASKIKNKIAGKKMEQGGQVLESGAISEKVDNLILFADNTRNIAEMRDSVYSTIESRIKRGGKPTIAEIANRFNTMLLKTQAQYIREMGNTEDAREEASLSEKEKAEFIMLYAMDFPSWLKEKHGRDVSHQVAEYVSELYGTKFASGGSMPDIDIDRVRAIKYWGELKPKQRLHFLIDHADEYFDKSLSELLGTKEFSEYKKLSSANWNSLPSGVQGSVENHVIMGTYSSGGSMATGGGVGEYERGKNYPVKTISASDCDKYNLSDYPNFSKTGSISGMKKMYYGKDALLVKCGSYIYNVTSNPEIYFTHAYEDGGSMATGGQTKVGTYKGINAVKGNVVKEYTATNGTNIELVATSDSDSSTGITWNIAINGRGLWSTNDRTKAYDFYETEIEKYKSYGGSMATGGGVGEYKNKSLSEVSEIVKKQSAEYKKKGIRWEQGNDAFKVGEIVKIDTDYLRNAYNDVPRKVSDKGVIMYSIGSKSNVIVDGVVYSDFKNEFISSGGSMETGGEIEISGYTSSNPDIDQYIKDDVDATTKGLLLLIECTTDEREKENLRKRLKESN